MMDFSDIINDLVKLEGIRLNSIRPGAEITIKEVDLDQKKVIVESSSGKLQSRPFSEFQRIWEALLASPAIRVEEVLNGSGSSRNQPETIFANLPYIQWLKIDNKKHISFVNSSTHPYGTIQQMDAIQAANLLEQNASNSSRNPLVLIVTDNISGSDKFISALSGITATADLDGCYLYKTAHNTIVLGRSDRMGIPCGTYAEVKHIPAFHAHAVVRFLSRKWAVSYKNCVFTLSELTT
jgi:hypothetical protein